MTLPAHNSQASRHDLPLGTAAWWTFPKDKRPVHKRGDLFVGYLPTGEGVGVRDEGHTLVVARTRMGKGTSFIIPNLLTWPGSVFVIDPKGENARVTARQRGMGSKYVRGMKRKSYLLDPMHAVKRNDDDFADMRVGFNPLDLLRPGSDEMLDDAARIADALIVSDQQSPDPFWEDAARMLVRSLILHVATAPRHIHERNLVTVRRLLVEGDQVAAALDDLAGIRMLFQAMRSNPAMDGVIASAGRMLAQLEERSPRTSGSVFQVAITNTNFIDSPPMRRSLSESGFSLSELKTDPKGVSVYVCLEDRFMGEHFRWLRMLTSLAIAEMERIPGPPASGHPVLTILDEFAALRRMRHIETAAAQVAGYGMKLVFIVQSLAQIKAVYADNWETFVANCVVKLFWGNEDQFTKEYVSRMLGDIEVGRSASSSSSSEGKSTNSSWSSSRSVGYSETHGTTWNSQGGFSDSSSATSSVTESTSSSSSHGTSQSSTRGQSESVHKRPLLAPEEIGRLFGDPNTPRALALIAGRPLYLHRTAYFDLPILEGYYEPHTYDGTVKLVETVRWEFVHRAVREQREEKERVALAQERERQRLESMRAAQEYAERVRKEADLQEEARREALRLERARAAARQRTLMIGAVVLAVVLLLVVAA